MIAVDRSREGEGLGPGLAIDALDRVLDGPGEVGINLVAPDVIDDGGDEAFARCMQICHSLGFQSFQDRPVVSMRGGTPCARGRGLAPRQRRCRKRIARSRLVDVFARRSRG